MTTKYSEEFKSSIIARLLSPNNVRIPDLAKETGIPKDTLYTWRIKHRGARSGDPGQSGQLGQYSAEEKLAVVIETASLNEVEFGEYCRRKGLYPEQITGWKSVIMQGLTKEPRKAEREQLLSQSKTIKQLERELHRKEKALAEAAALLVLQKKFQALLEGHEDARLAFRSANN